MEIPRNKRKSTAGNNMNGNGPTAKKRKKEQQSPKKPFLRAARGKTPNKGISQQRNKKKRAQTPKKKHKKFVGTATSKKTKQQPPKKPFLGAAGGKSPNKGTSQQRNKKKGAQTPKKTPKKVEGTATSKKTVNHTLEEVAKLISELTDSLRVLKKQQNEQNGVVASRTRSRKTSASVTKEAGNVKNKSERRRDKRNLKSKVAQKLVKRKKAAVVKKKKVNQEESDDEDDESKVAQQLAVVVKKEVMQEEKEKEKKKSDDKDDESKVAQKLAVVVKKEVKQEEEEKEDEDVVMDFNEEIFDVPDNTGDAADDGDDFKADGIPHEKKPQVEKEFQTTTNGSNVVEPKKRYELFIGNISYDANREQVREHFAKCGEIIDVRLIRHIDTKRSRGFAFLELSNEEGYKNAFAMEQSQMNGRRIHVDYIHGNGGQKKDVKRKNNEKVKKLKLHAKAKQRKVSGGKLARNEPEIGLKAEVLQLRQTQRDLLDKITYNALKDQRVLIDRDLQNKSHSLMTDIRCLDLHVRLRDPASRGGQSDTDRNIELTRMEKEIPPH